MSAFERVAVAVDVIFVVTFPVAMIVDWMFGNIAPAWIAAMTGVFWWATLNRLERGIARRAHGSAAGRGEE